MYHNSEILKQHHYDIDTLIASYSGSELSYGAEFRPTSILRPLLNRYLSWDHFSSYLDHGFTAEFISLSEDARLRDINAAIS